MTLAFGEPDRHEIPSVLTPRLLLRGWRAEDVEPYLAMARHPDMSLYTGSPGTADAVRGMTAFQIGLWALNGFGMWLAFERETGEFVGRAGLYYEPGWPGTEVAWTMRRDRWGLGYATEGGRAALEFAFDHVGSERVISIIHPENTASIRVAHKLGLIHAEGPVDRDGEPRNIYAISRETWEQRPRIRRLVAGETTAMAGPEPDPA